MLALLMLIALTVTSFAANQIEVYPDNLQDMVFLNRGLPPSEYGLHPSTSSSYGESWFIVAYDNQRNSVWALVSVSNYHPFKKMAGTVDICYYEGEKSYCGHGEYDKDSTSAEQNKLNVAVGNCRIYGKYPTFFYKLKEGNVEMDLKFEAKLPSSMTGGSKVFFNNRKQFWADGVLAPYADVSGTVTVDGKSRNFTGFGYADHGYATIKVPTFSKRWHILRAFDGHNAINYIQIVTKDDFQPREVGHLLYGRDGKIFCNAPDFALLPVKTAIEPKTGLTYATEYELSYKGPNVQISGKIKVFRIIEAIDVFRILSAPVRMVVKTLYSNAYQFRYVGEVDMEIKDGDQVYKFNAPCVGEQHFY